MLELGWQPGAAGPVHGVYCIVGAGCCLVSVLFLFVIQISGQVAFDLSVLCPLPFRVAH